MTFRASRIEGGDGLILRALTLADLPTLTAWSAEPHVRHRWGTETAADEIVAHIGHATVMPYLIVDAGKPVGYLQTYHANPDEFWAGHDLPRETYGLDLFIGPAALLGRGIGSRAIRLAVRHLASLPDAARIHIDPSPDNAVAIHVYAKAGFVAQGEIATPDGPAHYMILDPRAMVAAREKGKDR